MITGFTIGHSLTLALAVTGVIRPHAEYIDALIGLTIALVGAENIAAQSGRPAVVGASVVGLLAAMALGKLLGLGGLPALLLLGAGLFSSNYLMVSGHLRDAARIRLVVTLMFGLIHGFGFAANLLDERLPKGRLAELILGFNIGWRSASSAWSWRCSASSSC
ncbi:MAG: HupE/UreJ family protein [Caulobacteraceae bacterium]